MTYAVDNALFQWEEGQRRLADAGDPALGRAVDRVLDELRRRLGSTFSIEELAALYGEGTGWAEDLAGDALGERSTIVDAAFARYAREAADYAGGRRRGEARRPADV